MATMEQQIAELRARVEAMEAASGLFVADRELDSAKGDPRAKFSPKRWRGRDFKGQPMSACAPDFLDAYAEALQYSAEHPKEGKEQFAAFDRKDAARARSWARRMRAGWKAPELDLGGGGAPSATPGFDADQAAFAAPAADFEPPPAFGGGFDPDTGEVPFDAPAPGEWDDVPFK